MESSILKQGWIEKRSRFIREWRRRWMVLTTDTLRTYKNQGDTGNPTETIPLQRCSTVKSADEDLQKAFSFRIESRDRTFFFCAENQAEKENWIGCIGRAMVKPSVMRTQSEDEALNGY